tara:strand:+ start:400 stop:894 length:495 start_codon:yes stop_codon:yes gene_type:complete
MTKLSRIITVFFKASDEVIKAVGEDHLHNYEKENKLESSIIQKKEFKFCDKETSQDYKKELDCVRKEYHFKSYKELVNDRWFLKAVKDNKYPILNFKITDDNEKYTERKTIRDFMIPYSETSINILKCLDYYLDYERKGYDLVYTKTKNAKKEMKRVHCWGREI